MKKNTITTMKTQKVRAKGKKKITAAKEKLTIGIDLGDINSNYCVLNEAAEVVQRGQVATSKNAMTHRFGKMAACLIVIEVGTHSAWVSRLLASFGHEVIVANPRYVKLIGESGPDIAEADPTPRGRGATRLGQDPRASGNGGSADMDDELRARAGEIWW
jgi:hypothetical protein